MLLCTHSSVVHLVITMSHLKRFHLALFSNIIINMGAISHMTHVTFLWRNKNEQMDE